MNRVMLTGNITRDADLRYTQNDKAYSKFSIANNEGYGDNKKTNFFNCTWWGKSAENLNRFLVKGQKVLITGKIELGKYTDKEGIERTTVDINVDSFGGVELLGNKAQQESGTNNNTSNNSYSPIDSNDDMDVLDDDNLTVIDYGDLPFN